MSWKNVDISIRGKLVNWAILGTSIVTLAAAITIFAVAHSYMYGREHGVIDRVIDDLREEYSELGGLSEQFLHCVNEDVEEHDANTTRICITSTDGADLYSTPELRWQDHETIVRTTVLLDGNVITMVRDTEDIFDFLKFLAITLGLLLIVSVVLSGFGAYLIGGRILRLNDLMADKDRAYRELRHLTDDIAHDLRTPLTRLSMAAEIDLAGGSRSEPLAVQVMGESRSMLELINTMLAISQTEAKIDRSPRENIDLSNFLRNICDLYLPAAEDAGVNFTTDIPREEIIYSGHKSKLQQLVGNLFDNALKFTPRGGSISVSLNRDRDNVVLSVKDTGCGIAPEDIPNVFKRFWRADTSRHLQGNGLGLALAHAIVVSYGGKITCTSEIGKGAEFTVTLPL